MRGAVLHKLGLDFVRERIMRLSYGISTCPLFRTGYHPCSGKFIHIDGHARCRELMEWYAAKVLYISRGIPEFVLGEKVANGAIIEHDFSYSLTLTEHESGNP